ncbi:thioredoxin domain-containing protein [Paracoccus sp. TOH]|uniref:Thioredoxin domain-containing protein n=1 Tax=Paracoccus simplex TaxID=2086346 RepID=A0ABV7RY25_9RHOB|nr:thioredoxin domain-containing protein [Paracoccus sp. TOH]WJS87050.1 thioredoxin domain-containing protein [Paracoccus sp. TOH]
MPGTDSLIVCPACGALNRLPSGHDPRAGRCGKCRLPLFSGQPADVGGQMFARQIGRNSIPVLVDVWAPWCGPCRMMAPQFARAAGMLEPEVRLIKLNSEAEPQTAAGLGIRGIPTLLLYRGGQEIGRQSGAMDAAAIVGWTRGQLGR